MCKHYFQNSSNNFAIYANNKLWCRPIVDSTHSRRNEAVELFRQARDFSAFSLSLGRQRDRKTILEKGAWSRRLVTVCSMKYERGNLIKTFSTRFAWTLTRRLLTQRRQGEFCLLAVWRNIRNWTFFSRFMAMTCKRTTML